MSESDRSRVQDEALEDFRASLRGGVLTPTDAGYDEVRRIHNGMFVRRPALIARCLGTADVVDAVRFARTHDLELAVRGGGHSVAGKSVCEGGLMLDLSLMKGIHVDPAAPHGARPGRRDVGRVQPRDPAPRPRHDRRRGLHDGHRGSHARRRARLAHGQARARRRQPDRRGGRHRCGRRGAGRAPRRTRDLFWGLRGGGGNFGVVSWLEYRLHPVGPVTSGLVAHPIERARDVLRFFRDVTSSVPDELTLYGGLLHAPDGSGLPLAVIVGCHCGSLAEGEAAMRPIKRFGSPVLDTIGPASYVDTNTTIFDPGFPRGARNYWKSSFLAELERLGDRRAHRAVRALPLADERAAPRALPWGRRTRRRRRDGVRSSARELQPAGRLRVARTHGRREEHRVGSAPPTTRCARTWPASRMRTTRPRTRPRARCEHAYGPNYERLVALKNKLDPTNLFHLNTNVRPTV